MVDPIKEFENERRDRIKSNVENLALKQSAEEFNFHSNKARYSYNFSWMGRPIIQYPQDIMAMQEIIWNTKPDLIIETGIAHGGSIIFYASILELIGHGEVLGIDIDIRKHNRKEIEQHSMFKRIKLLEGSSISPEIVEKVKIMATGRNKIMVILDSNHTHEHVINEIRMYAPLVSIGSYLVVFDTIVENLPNYYLPDRPWGKGNNPMTAVKEFLKDNDNFVIDREMDNKLLISVTPEGYLMRIK